MPNTTDTVKAILTPGEFVIRKEAVDMIGVPTLEKLNDMPEAGGHSEIDRLIAQATLKNMTGMYGGGMVNAKQYGTGGMVNQYQNGGKAMPNLKPVPDNNPGLGKLPEDVRNKMGYMQEGGQAFPEMDIRRQESNIGVNPYRSYKYLRGVPSVDDPLYSKRREFIDSNIANQSAFRDIIPAKELLSYKKFIQAGEGNMRDELLLNKLKDALNDYYRIGDKGRVDLANLNELARKGYNISSEEKNKSLMDLLKASDRVEDVSFKALDEVILPKDDAMMKYYQDGGAVQDSAMMQQEQPNPFVPFDQRPNQAPATGNWGQSGDYMRSLRGELEMENEELTKDKMQNFLERLRLDSLSEKIERSPQDSMYYRNTPQQDYFMNKYREEMINPNYFPEGN